jgi:hypothetical protein
MRFAVEPHLRTDGMAQSRKPTREVRHFETAIYHDDGRIAGVEADEEITLQMDEE